VHLGLSSYTYPWAVGVPGYWPDQPLTPLDLLERTREAGLRYLQIGDNLPLHTQTAAGLDALHAEARAAGVGIQVGTRRLEAAHLRRYLALAERFGSPFLRVVIDDADYHPDVATVVPMIQAVLPDFRAAGVVLAIENHDRFPARTLVRIIEQTDPEWVGICLDTANSIGAGEGVDTVVEVLAPYTVNLHLKDVRIERLPHKMGFTVSGCAAGEGLIPIPELIRHLDTTGRCATATLEIWSNPAETVLDCIQKEAILADRSISYLRSLFT
jgi:sugar phosphate isomerase/epimerase